MKERPILFNGEMVRAVLNGTKTQTRRVVKPPKIHMQDGSHIKQFTFASDDFQLLYVDEDSWMEVDNDAGCSGEYMTCPYGVKGDHLWVRETWRDGYKGTNDPYLYRATYEGGADHKWRPSIFMPRRASRITLEIKTVWVERVKDITPNDVVAEGVKWQMGPDSTVLAFKELWNSINEKRGYGWDENPHVWVIEFELAKYQLTAATT